MNWKFARKFILIGFMIVLANKAFGEKLHFVKRNETLQKISYQYFKTKSCWRQIQRANDMSTPNMLEVGDQITIPDWSACYEPKKHAQRQMANASSWGYRPSKSFKKVIKNINKKNNDKQGELLIFKRN